jgi:2-keto-4-pentenoate hydratase/2-oxohepta-3-ene-1,7-dioic acid hydratase in catechol pathway
MQLVRFAATQGGNARLGALTPRGILDLATAVELHHLSQGHEPSSLPGSPADLFRPENVDLLALVRTVAGWAQAQGSASVGALFLQLDAVRLLAPVGRPPKILCIGLNYRDHCVEQGHPIPKTPVVFAKFGTSVCDPDGAIRRPRVTKELDYEAELGVVIGRGGRHISEERALEHVAGYLNLNDVTARDLQRLDGQWVRGKSCDTFAPMGPALVTADEVPDPQNLAVRCRVNGQTVQESNTNQMIFTVAHLVAFVSEFTTLETGDVIATGTPPGVGVWKKPPQFLQPGDRVEVEIEGLGVLRNSVEDED